MDYKELLATWPQDASGQPEKAVLLKTEADFPAFGGLCLSMLDSFGIPYLTDRPGVGEVANIQGGFSPEGVRIYVPLSRFAEAKELLNAPAVLAGEDFEEETQ